MDQWFTYITSIKIKEKKEIILASILVLILNFLFISSKIPLKYEYYNSKNNTRYSNPNEFINTNTTNFNDLTSSLVRIYPNCLVIFF